MFERGCLGSSFLSLTHLWVRLSFIRSQELKIIPTVTVAFHAID